MQTCNGKIKYLVMDVDGTLTDGKLYIGNEGELFKAFNVKDGCGINVIAKSEDITPIIITSRNSQIVLNRCRELGITEIFQGVVDKKEKLMEIVDDFTTVAYIGDDINDLNCMRFVHEKGGVVGCPANAVSSVKEISDFVSGYNGGDGAVRDFIEWIVFTYK